MIPITGIILAGGIGKRFWPLSIDKSLIPFCGKPIIEYSIDDLITAGIEKIIIVTNKNNNQMIKKIAKRKEISNLTTIIQDSPLGMADALNTAFKLLKNEPVIIINAHDLYHKNVYREFIENIKDQEILLGGLEVSTYLHGGYFKLKSNEMIGLIEKPGMDNEPSNLFKPMIDYFREPKKLLSLFKSTGGFKDDLYERSLNYLISKQKVQLVKIRGFLQQLKYPWQVLEMMNFIFKYRFETGIDKNAFISPKASVDTQVKIKGGVRIEAGAIIKGPVYIGENTIIGNQVLFRNSMIGKNCTVGYSTEVARSWIGDLNWFHGNFIGDSVIQGKSNFGAGAKTANLRLDEKGIMVTWGNDKFQTGRNKLGIIAGEGVKVGINASFMPGILLGRDSVIGPGIILNGNTLENNFYYGENNIKIKKIKK